MPRNYPLMIGLLLVTLFFLVGVFGSWVAPHDPAHRFTDVIQANDRTYIPSVTPIPPLVLDFFPLGTDHVGRDLLTRLLWAVRPTLITCFGVVLARLLIGLPLGIVAGWFRGRPAGRGIQILSSALIAIPPLILAIALIALSPGRPLAIFILVLGLIGWTDIATFYQNQTEILKKQGFVESAYALGSSTPGILWRHILPQFWTTLPTILAFELSATLLLMAELGFLGLFIGDGLIVYGADPNSAGVIAIGRTSDFPELGQMLSDFTRKMFQSPWEMVMSATTIFLMVFGFNMLGDGLRRRKRVLG